MADSYLSIATAADNYSMQRRVSACAAQQDAPGDPYQWTVERKYEWAAAPGWGAAWDSALASHPDDPEFDPGADASVITDGMILGQVQLMLADASGTMRHVTPLLAAAALLIGGGYSYAAEETVPGVSLLAAGLIVLGAWLALEVRGVVRPTKAREDWTATDE